MAGDINGIFLCFSNPEKLVSLVMSRLVVR